VTLSQPQIAALRYAKGRMLYARDLNNGNGNMRRTLLSLLKLKMLDWHSMMGYLVVTPAGLEQIDRARAKKLAKVRKTIDDPRTRLNFHRMLRDSEREQQTDWSGLCPAGKHGLDYRGQACDLCEGAS
jgi:hypothetical protein